MTKRRRTPGHDRPWKLIAAFGVFWLFLLIMALPVLLGAETLTPGGAALMLLCGGFCVAGIGLVPVPGGQRRAGAGGSGPSVWMWVWFLLGVALWCAAPIVLLAGGAGAGALVGGPGRALPVWALAILTWGTAVLMLVALVRQIIRRKRGARARPQTKGRPG